MRMRKNLPIINIFRIDFSFLQGEIVDRIDYNIENTSIKVILI